MARQGMSRDRAEMIAKAYQHLVGQQFDTDEANSLLIDCVTVAPFEDSAKYIFVLQYRDCGDLDQALRMYDGQLFDVVVITYVVSDRRKVLFTDLGTYLFERNIVYDTDAAPEPDGEQSIMSDAS